MIGKLADKLYDKVQECRGDASDSDLKEITKIMNDMKKNLKDIAEDDIQDFVNDFIKQWDDPKYLKKNFAVFADNLNEVVLELGNEGYFDELEDEY